MRSGPFELTMRHGAKILFVLFVIQLAATLLPSLVMFVSSLSQMAADHYSRGSTDGVLLQLSMALQAIGGLALTLFAALVVDRMDRWLAARGIAERDE